MRREMVKLLGQGAPVGVHDLLDLGAWRLLEPEWARRWFGVARYLDVQGRRSLC